MSQVQARVERCNTCGTPTAPQVYRVTKEEKLVTEAHYICANPRCRCRFKIAALSTEDIKSE